MEVDPVAMPPQVVSNTDRLAQKQDAQVYDFVSIWQTAGIGDEQVLEALPGEPDR